jgi:phosphatidylglycerophosphatase A
MTRIVMLLATGLGLGYSPVAPGTAGAALGVALAAALAPLDAAWQIAASVLMAALAIPICGVAETRLKRKDDRRIVADEYLTFPLCVLGLPWVQHPWLLALAFVTHRLMDIVKPPPARSAQGLRGGLGVAADDIISSLYALALNHVAWRLACRFG